MPEQDQRLEQRVKTLEYELKILKNEIQKTLLEIQEQVLVHYYPTLRAEESNPGEEIRQTFENLQQKKGSPAELVAAPKPKSVVAEPAPAAAPAMMKAVSLDDLRRGPAAAPAAAQPAAVAGENAAPGEQEAQGPQALVSPVSPEEQAIAVALSAWVSNTAEKLGGERLGKLLEVCAQRRVVGPQYGDLLKRLSVFANGTAGPERVPVNDFLQALLKLDEALGRQPDVDRALSLIEEMKVG